MTSAAAAAACTVAFSVSQQTSVPINRQTMEATGNMVPANQSQLHDSADWIKLLCYSITCQHQDADCPLGERCSIGKAVLRHMIVCDTSTCEDTRCAQFKVITEHYITCTVSV